jgi:hypothetical protein
MGTRPLNVSVSTILNGPGKGTVSAGPSMPGVEWYPSTVAVTVSPVSTTTISQFALYNGAAGAANFLGGTYTGDQNSDDISVVLYPGMVLTGVWTLGNPGAVATMVITGTMKVPG